MYQTQTPRYVLRFEHAALRPRLHTEGFPLTCPHRTPTQGTSTEDLGQYNREYTIFSQLQAQPLRLEARHKATQINLTNEG